MAKIITVKDMDANAIGMRLTDYNCEAGDFKWRIFHVDGKNVYIITDDYIPFNVAPLGKKGTPLCVNDEYMLSFDDIVRDYKGIQDITDPRIKALNSLYFKANKAKNNTNKNMRAVSYMLDTKVWGKFANEHSEYAIGSPTLELFVKSYNLTHERKLKIMSNEVGYMINYQDEHYFYWYVSGLDSRSSLYFNQKENKAYATWLASPSADNAIYVMYVYFDGDVSGCDYSAASLGLRPLVCLKSDIRFEETEAGFRII